MKLRKIILLTGVMMLFADAVFFVFLPQLATAQSGILDPGCVIADNDREKLVKTGIKINMPLPGVTYKVVDAGRNFYYVKDLPCFVIGIYTYLAGAAGILATVMIMYGGIKYITSFGNQTRISEAKDTIFTSIVGFVLILGAYVILNFINPNISSLKLTPLDNITGIAIPKIDNWEGIKFCQEKADHVLASCGGVWAGPDQPGCTFITTSGTKICIATKESSQPEVKIVENMLITHGQVTEEFRGNQEYSCGSIVFREGSFPLGGKIADIGTNCGDEELGCLIFKDNGYNLFTPEQLAARKDKTIGKFTKYTCK